MQRLERLIRMIEVINKQRCPSTEDFCEMFECKPRTVYADIAYIKEFLGYPIEWDAFKKGYVNTDPTKRLPEFDLNYGEIVALTIGKDMLAEYAGTAFESVLESALEKIGERLPEKIRMNLSDLVNVVRFKTSGVIPISRKQFFELNTACENQNVVELVYFSAHNGQSTFRQIEPLRMVENRGAWYCVSWCRLRQAVRMFALHRITEYKILNETFDIREGVDVDNYLDSAFLLEHGDPLQKFVIKFDPTAARYVRERQWHASQQLTEHEDGSCTLSFTATRVDEVKRWVLAYGASAEVVEPLSLRKLIVEEYQRGLALYARRESQRGTRQRKLAAQTVNEPGIGYTKETSPN